LKEEAMAYRERIGALLIADLSGYTEYLGQEELAHAQAIVSRLLEAIIDAAGERLELIKLEGDAAFFVAEESSLPGPELRAAIARMFRTFHETLVHRFLKNGAGLREYALFTRAVLQRWHERACRFDVWHRYGYDHLGAVEAAVCDLRALFSATESHN
jgi:class 3 adenylate cyclase